MMLAAQTLSGDGAPQCHAQACFSDVGLNGARCFWEASKEAAVRIENARPRRPCATPEPRVCTVG
eukprot:scaffold57325_cov47-Phaeocystis_antarctica.AAC.1